MKRFKFWLALIVASVCSIQGMRAERVAPVFPSDQAKTLEDGGTYYLYNVGADRFVYVNYYSPNNSYTLTTSPTSGSSFYFTNVSDDIYTMKYNKSNAAIYTYSDGGARFLISQSPSTSQRMFYINAVEGGYTIRYQGNDESKYVGLYTSGSGYSFAANLTEGDIVWQLYDEDGVNAIIHYLAKKTLYDALEAAEGLSSFIQYEEYEQIYADEASTTAELNNAANALTHVLRMTRETTPDWTDYPIYIEGSGWDTSDKIANCIYGYAKKGSTTSCTATVTVDEASTLVYQYYTMSDYAVTGRNSSTGVNGSNYNTMYYGIMTVLLDGVEVQTIGTYEGYDKVQNYFVELAPGTHTIEWQGTGNYTDYYSFFTLRNIGVQKTPTVTVNLTQAGSLGTEILYNVDHLKDVRKLTIRGNMNSDDWERVNMLTGLFELNLAEANVEEVPVIKPSSFFHKVTLPNSLKSIADDAFVGVPLDEITFPSTLTSIGIRAFRDTRIREAIIPNSVTTIGKGAFSTNQSLVRAVYPEDMTVIPDSCFRSCSYLETFTIPENVTAINAYAFSADYKLKTMIPSSVKSIGRQAFYNNNGLTTISISDNASILPNAFQYCYYLTNVTIGKNCSIGYEAFKDCTRLEKAVIGEGSTFNYYYYPSSNATSTTASDYYYTFSGCTALKELELPTTFYTISKKSMLLGCTGLGDGGIVTFKSPTMVDGTNYQTFFKDLGTNITIRVPDYLVNTYKLDSYWYNYNIEGFSTEGITDWTINNALTFYSRDRFAGMPNVIMNSAGSWNINGELAQNINDFTTYVLSQSGSGDVGNAAKMISTCDNVNVNGTYKYRYYAYNTYYEKNYGTRYGRWHFLCLPFDFKVSDITCTNNAQFAIRYYDGANRAANGTGGNWKDYESNAVVPAGTGFIIQVSTACYVDFYALDNASKQNVVSSTIFTKALAANDSEQSSNKGWNLVGNPWLAYYNIHKLNFTGAITVYNGYTKTYTAYSIIDDDYAIQPGQAFFVQCPDEVTEISFPVDGRQLTNVIESQNGVKAQTPQERNRWLIDVQLSDGEQSDKTRFVLNEQAAMGYETSRDASKFIENGTACPQLYTIEQGEMLAINERPMADGTVQLGMMIATEGTYTLSALRNQFERIILIDLETGNETDLCKDSYTFHAEAGTDNTRFELRFISGGTPTGIATINDNDATENYPVYTIDGRQVAKPAQKGIYIVGGKKVVRK